MENELRGHLPEILTLKELFRATNAEYDALQERLDKLVAYLK